MAQVVSVNISEKKGMRKHPVPYIDVRLRHGIVGDAHAGDWHRQISLLAVESVDAMRADCPVPLDSGVFAENINTAGIDLRHLPVGTLLRVGLTEEQLTRLPNMLSGGEQQRVAIARALASGSELILADEPTGNLDSENSRNIVEILQSVAHDEQRCVIVVTHDPDGAASADVCLHMKDGKLQ